MEKREQITQPIVLFDGVCNLCSGSVQFIIKHDKKNIFKFASLQSQFAQSTLLKYKLPLQKFDSFILIEQDKIYTKSTGALMVAKRLSGLLPLLYVFIIITRFLRDAVYSYVAQHRYKWFGKKQECWVPSAELQKKFIN